jgi:hypothetical protein
MFPPSQSSGPVVELDQEAAGALRQIGEGRLEKSRRELRPD